MTFSIIKKSQLEGALRLDAEYYQPEFLEFQKITSGMGTRLEELVEFIRHPTEIERIYQENGRPYLLTQNINKDSFILDCKAEKFISEERAERISRNELNTGDIVMTRTGANFGDSAIYFNEPEKLLASAHILMIRPKSISGEYLVSFLNSSIGRSLVSRGVYGGLQPEITPEYIKSIFVPKITHKEEKFFVDKVDESFKELKNSKKFYQQAEELLLKELGLENFESKKTLFSTANLSDCQKANRIDAEYFQPKYQSLVSRIMNSKYKRFSDFVSDYTTGYPFSSENYQEQGTPLIRINNIKKGFIDLNDTAFLTHDDFKRSPKDTAKPGDIVLSMSGTVGSAALIPKDIPECAVNQRILKFTPQNTDADFLVLLLNSIVGAYQLQRIGTGGVQTNISYNDIKNILIPILPKPTQQKIADLVRKSHIARQKSKELLEKAKRKVEEMIERGGE